ARGIKSAGAGILCGLLRPLVAAELGVLGVGSLEASPELQAVVARFFTAINDRDLPTVLNLHSDEPGILSIGTDPDEWWSGYRVVSSIFEAQMGEYDGVGVTLDPGPIEAYVEGTMGWAACRPKLVF